MWAFACNNLWKFSVVSTIIYPEGIHELYSSQTFYYRATKSSVCHNTRDKSTSIIKPIAIPQLKLGNLRIIYIGVNINPPFVLFYPSIKHKNLTIVQSNSLEHIFSTKKRVYHWDDWVPRKCNNNTYNLGFKWEFIAIGLSEISSFRVFVTGFLLPDKAFIDNERN